jgi:hypothetical protein
LTRRFYCLSATRHVAAAGVRCRPCYDPPAPSHDKTESDCSHASRVGLAGCVAVSRLRRTTTAGGAKTCESAGRERFHARSVFVGSSLRPLLREMSATPATAVKLTQTVAAAESRRNQTQDGSRARTHSVANRIRAAIRQAPKQSGFEPCAARLTCSARRIPTRSTWDHTERGEGGDGDEMWLVLERPRIDVDPSGHLNGGHCS